MATPSKPANVWRNFTVKTLDTTLYLVTDSTGLSEEVFLEKVELALQGGVT